jgi:hypothetical protein
MMINLRSGELCLFSPCQGQLDRPYGAVEPPEVDMPPNYTMSLFLQIFLAPLADHPVEMGLSLSCWVLVAKGDA